MAISPESKDESIRQKDPVDLIIMLSGIVVGVLILIGFVVTLIPFLNPTFTKPPVSSSSPLQTGVTLTTDTSEAGCDHCLFLSNNTKEIQASYPEDFTLELPEATYPRKSLLLFGNPSGTLELVGDIPAPVSGDWAVTLRTTQAGAGDVVVPASTPSASDFHISFTIH